jgi:exopolysaccharide biosynthesis polyprenyl glycosylphosphotransferase
MLREHSRLFGKIHLFTDLGLTAISFFLAYLLGRYANLAISPLLPISHYLFILYIIMPLWAILLNYNKCYQPVRTKDIYHVILPVLKAVFAGGFIVMTVLFIFKLQTISRALILLFLSVNVILLSAKRICLYVCLHYIRKRGRNFKSILIVGTGKRARAFAETILKHKEWGLKIVGFLDMEPSMVGQDVFGNKVIGQMDDLPDILSKYQVDEVVFVVPRKWLDHIEKAILSCEEIGVKVRIACDFFQKGLTRTHLDTLADWPLLSLSSPPHYGDHFVIKRAFDIIFSSILLLVTSTPLFFIALGIKLTSPGPVFFKQERCGMNGRRFELLKFRTMVENAEEIKSELEDLNEMSGPVFKARNDHRITPFGRFLRKFSLDEFPQFINVLNGDMSIVGPRPPIPAEVEQYDYSQRRRLSVHPGLTCLWQVNGRNSVGFKDWVRLDLEYIDKWSLGLDMKIILKTIPAVLKGTGL